MSEKRQIVKGSAVFAAMTVLSRISGYLRDLVRAIYLGTTDASDAFGMAIMIPNLLRRFVGEGAMAAALVPVLSEVKNRSEKEWREYLGSFLTLFTAVLALLAVGGALLSPILVPEFFARGFAENPAKLELTVHLTEIAFAYLFFIGLAAFLQGILNTFKVFGPSAFTPVLLNFSIITFAVALSPVLEQPAYAFVIGFVVGGFLQFAFQIPFLKRVGVKIIPAFAWGSKWVVKSLKLMLPALFGFGVYEINVALSQMIASYLGEGAISSLQYSIRFMELPLGIFVAAVSTVVLPTLSERGHAGDLNGYSEHLVFALRLVLFLTLPALAFMFSLRTQMFSALLGYGVFGKRSVELTAFAFAFHVLGLPLVGVSRVLVPAFYALYDTKTPVIAAFFAMIVNVALCAFFAFETHLGNGGIALAATLSAAVQVILLVWFLHKKGIKFVGKQLFVPLTKVCLASLFVFAVAQGSAAILSGVNSKIITIAGLGLSAIACGIVYVGVLFILGAEEGSFILSRLIRRLQR